MTEPLARYLDAAVLRPELTQAEAKEAMGIAIRHCCRTICVRPCDLNLAIDLCAGTDTGVSCVLAFPHGDASTRVKLLEAEDSARLGVCEIDMVMNYGWLRSGEDGRVLQELSEITALCHARGVALKVILETALLTPEQIDRAVELSVQARADFVKTSTGFASGGATEHAVARMLKAAASRVAVKASGGIRTADQAWHYVQMGCVRLGVNAAAVPGLIQAEGSVGSVYP